MARYKMVMKGGFESTVEANNIVDFYERLMESGVTRGQIKELWVKLTVRLGEEADDE